MKRGAAGEAATPEHVNNNSTNERIKRRARVPFPETSLDAYERAKRGRPVYDAILAILAQFDGLTDDQLYRLYLDSGHTPKSRQRIGTARRQLADTGRVIDTGRHGLSNLGNRAKLWALAAEEGAL